MAGTDETGDATADWGRVAEDGTVYVREADGEREVGSYPDATPEEALAYFRRKFDDLAAQVGLLEQRARHGASPTDVAKGVRHLTSSLVAPSAVGDLESLRRRLAVLDTTVGELTQQQTADNKKAIEDAVAERTAIVTEAERLAAEDPQKVQWKSTTAAMDELFARWQAHQHDGPRLPKGEANELWRRFRAARTTIEQNRRAFFAELDATHRDARNRKQALIERAEALQDRGADGIPAYRALLDEWKQAGRAGKRHDDALWSRFKEIGDVLYGAKAESAAQENEEQSENLAAKERLLLEAEPLLQERDHERARRLLTSLQLRWDEIGRVPRERVRPIEDRLRAVEAHVRSLEDDHWRRSNPETKARSQGLASQLEAAISKLEAELVEARRSGDRARVAQAEEALNARRVWLDAIGR